MVELDIQTFIGSVYLVSVILFVLGLKRMSSPATARSGNLLASIGMFIAVVGTLFDRSIISYQFIIVGILIGSVVGTVLARTIKMTAMPQMVAVFNGLGGGASALIASAEFVRLMDVGDTMSLDVSVTMMLGILIGLVTLSGSFVAFGKLQEVIPTRPLIFPLRNMVSALLFMAVLAMMIYSTASPQISVFAALTVGCLILGVMLVIPIGSGDMPVVISLLNSYSGLAAASAGFVLGNPILIVAGALVGAAGMILTLIMTKAMNRSILNVMFGAFGNVDTTYADRSVNERAVREVTTEDASISLSYARNAIFVPGYGLAVSRAQHQMKELADLMTEKGVEVKYAIHPVAGRMPGHMNVLLAEADVPYDKLYDLDQINNEFGNTEIVLVVGANDVVNPAARDNEGSPIYGMPILNVDHAGHVLVLKRSLSPGFAGLDNDLFYKDNTLMLFGDARDSITRLVNEIKAL